MQWRKPHDWNAITLSAPRLPAKVRTRCEDSLVSPELAEDVAEEEADGDHQHDRLRDQAEPRLVQLRGVHLLADAGHKLAANLAPQTVCHARVQCGHF